MVRKHMVPVLFLIFVLVLQGCIPAAPATDTLATIDAAVYQTITAQSIAATATALSISRSTDSPAAGGTPQPPGALDASPSPQPTDSNIQPILNTGAPQVSVSYATNCRSGPGRSFDWLGGLLPGQTAAVLAQAPGTDYWLIQNPASPGTACWLWSGYASLSGDIASLPAEPAPAAPPSPVIAIRDETPCRLGPSPNYPADSTFPSGATADLVGRMSGARWWMARSPGDSSFCWIPSTAGELTGNIDSLPYVSAPTGTIAAAQAAVPTGSGTRQAVTTPAPPEGYLCEVTGQGIQTGANFKPGEDIDARWSVKNTGSVAWTPDEVSYAHRGREKMYKHEGSYRLTSRVEPGETVQILVDMVAPAETGHHRSNWGLKVGDSFFCKLPLRIDVVQPK